MSLLSIYEYDIVHDWTEGVISLPDEISWKRDKYWYLALLPSSGHLGGSLEAISRSNTETYVH